MIPNTNPNLLPGASPSNDMELFSPYDLIAMLARRYHWIIICIVLAVASTTVFVRGWPDEYRAETLIQVDPQKVPERFVSTTVTMDVSGRLSTINQQLMSATRLQKIIDTFELYKSLKRSKTSEEIIEQMRKDIKIEVVHNLESAGRNMSLGAFRIYYTGRDPKVIANVCNQIAAMFIDENLKVREAQAEGTSEFIDSRLEIAKQQLDTVEGKLREFKQRNMGSLPQQESTLMSNITRLDQNLRAETEALNHYRQQALLLEAQLVQMGGTIKTSGAPVDNGVQVGVAPLPGSDLLTRLKTQKTLTESNLDQLRLRYSDSYPEVIRVKAQLESVNKQINAEEARLAAQPPQAVVQTPGKDNSMALDPRDPSSVVRSQLALLREDIKVRTQRQAAIAKDLQGFQARLDAVPAREQEMSQTVRDSNILRDNYRTLQEKKIAADMFTDLEKRQKSERFTILDQAHAPERPFRPNRRIYQVGSFGVGLMLGLVMVFLMEWRDQSVKKEEEVGKLGLRVLGRIPLVVTAEESQLRRRNLLRNWAYGALATSAVLVVLCGVAFVATRIIFAG